MTSGPTIVWFRQDLRVTDNPALTAAVGREQPIVPLYILDDYAAGDWNLGAASRWWLHGSLAALETALGQRGAPLLLRRGPAAEVLEQLVAESGADAIYWNRCYEPTAIARDSGLKARFSAAGLAVKSFNSACLAEPWTLKTKSGSPFKVFAPFWRALRSSIALPVPLPAPGKLSSLPIRGEDLVDWRLRPSRPDWAEGLREQWQPGEAGGQERLANFLYGPIDSYDRLRDRPDFPGTSHLSPHLHWGEISPGQIWRAAAGQAVLSKGPAEGFLRQLAWRDFALHLLFHWPDLPEQPWKPAFAHFPWHDADEPYEAWCRGRTGYPIVDAGMRELWTTGWMHNRVRMIAASFLIKDLMISWQRGAAWFWDTLVDADLANNAAGWQWVAGSGADAAPYFRVFNPTRQGEKFDPDGTYVRRWLPELAALPSKLIHCPWQAPPEALSQAGIVLGQSYPRPIVDHAAARQRALHGYEIMKQAKY